MDDSAARGRLAGSLTRKVAPFRTPDDILACPSAAGEGEVTNRGIPGVWEAVGDVE
jgi:hypothetical protein